MNKLAGVPIESIQPAAIRCDPQLASLILRQRPDIVGAEAVGIAGSVSINREVVAIISIQAVLRPEPHEAVTILQDAVDRALAEALLQ